MSDRKRVGRMNGDRCGCAMGAKFLAAGLVVSLAWYGWQWHAQALALKTVCWRVVLVSFAAAVAGKLSASRASGCATLSTPVAQTQSTNRKWQKLFERILSQRKSLLKAFC